MTLSFDEMHSRPARSASTVRGRKRPLAEQPLEAMRGPCEVAEVIFRRVGVIFAVYSDKDENGAG